MCQMLSLDSGSMGLLFLQELNIGHRSQVVCYKVLSDTARQRLLEWVNNSVPERGNFKTFEVPFLRQSLAAKLRTRIPHDTMAADMSSDSFPRNYSEEYQCSLILLTKFTWDSRPAKGHCLGTVQTSILTTKKPLYFFSTVIKLKYQNFSCLHWPQAIHCGQLLACSTRVAIA